MSDRGRIIDGRTLAGREREGIAARVRTLRDSGFPPRLDAVLVPSGDGGEAGARVYAANQAKTCESLGIEYHLHEMPRGTGERSLLDKIDALNAGTDTGAIMVHMPLPDTIDEHEIKCRIDPRRDVEGVNPVNIGNIVYGQSSFAPCTALATLKMIDATGLDLRGKRVVVIGSSNTVGKPIAALLMTRDATVVSCNEWTWGIDDLARSADVLVAAVGKPGLITPDWVKPGAVIVDVGVNRVMGTDGKKKTVGDVHFVKVRPIAGWISPVPGGVGPMTVAVLLGNVVEVAERRAATENREVDSTPGRVLNRDVSS